MGASVAWALAYDFVVSHVGPEAPGLAWFARSAWQAQWSPNICDACRWDRRVQR